jgi:hypothetical protein
VFLDTVARMRGARVLVPGLVALAVLVAGCGGDDDDDAATATSGSTETTQADDATQNACPVEGCEITITDVAAEGAELRLTWSANYAPDFSKNHIHVFWDTYTADQVSDDAASRGVTQGEWVPTGDYPEFVTEGAVSTSVRGDSTTVCVTAGDRDHNVIDASIVNCRDVADLL